jgi:hypothetical protein
MKTLPEEIASRFHAWHTTAIRCMEGVTEIQARWRPARGPQCLVWQLWHVARWDDRFAQIIAERATGLRTGISREQVWDRESIRARWGWKPDLDLGRRDAGTGLTEEQAAALVFPTVDVVRDYAKRAFDYAESAVGALDPGAMEQLAGDDTESWTANALVYLEHVPEHVAAMKVLRELQALPTLDD